MSWRHIIKFGLMWFLLPLCGFLCMNQAFTFVQVTKLNVLHCNMAYLSITHNRTGVVAIPLLPWFQEMNLNQER